MTEKLRVPLDELLSATSILLEYLRETRGDAVELERDAYWSVPLDAAFDVYGAPPELTVGELTESWSQVRRIVEGESDPFAYGLVWLGDLFRALGQGADSQT